MSRIRQSPSARSERAHEDGRRSIARLLGCTAASRDNNNNNNNNNYYDNNNHYICELVERQSNIVRAAAATADDDDAGEHPAELSGGGEFASPCSCSSGACASEPSGLHRNGSDRIALAGNLITRDKAQNGYCERLFERL